MGLVTLPRAETQGAAMQAVALETVPAAELRIIDCRGLGKTYKSGKLEVRAPGT